MTTQLKYYQLAVLLTKLAVYLIIYDHIEILHKKTIQKTRLYKFIGVTYSQPLVVRISYLFHIHGTILILYREIL
jgi:hypothetical protein